MNKKTLEFLLSSILLLLGGAFLMQYPLFAIPAVIIGLFLGYRNLIKTSREINKKIEGEGTGKITVSDREPTEPNKGDLWVDTRKLKD